LRFASNARLRRLSRDIVYISLPFYGEQIR
jgi:hypothetical protein